MNTEIVVDVRSLHPRERHPKIFSEWDSLPVGGVLRLVNDHDPKPLYYEFTAERNGESEWSYLEAGPDQWVVEIKRVSRQKDASIASNKDILCRIRDDSARPGWLKKAPDKEVDVREDLRRGQEPFSKIMSAAEDVRAGEVLLVRAIFEPRPLYKVLGSKGFGYWTEKCADDDWKVYFLKKEAASVKISGDRSYDKGQESRIHKLDVRGLEPPEPMVRILSKLSEIGKEDVLEVTHFRDPIHLYPYLDESGFEYRLEKIEETLYKLTIKARQ